MNLIRSVFWIALFVASTFSFIVLFEHGISGNFWENCRREYAGLRVMFGLPDKADKYKADPVP